MKTLNLTDLERSEIKYKISKFPDGIYTTNSYKEHEDIVFSGDEPEIMNFVKQLNVF